MPPVPPHPTPHPSQTPHTPLHSLTMPPCARPTPHPPQTPHAPVCAGSPALPGPPPIISHKPRQLGDGIHVSGRLLQLLTLHHQLAQHAWGAAQAVLRRSLGMDWGAEQAHRRSRHSAGHEASMRGQSRQCSGSGQARPPVGQSRRGHAATATSWHSLEATASTALFSNGLACRAPPAPDRARPWSQLAAGLQASHASSAQLTWHVLMHPCLPQQPDQHRQHSLLQLLHSAAMDRATDMGAQPH